MGVRGEEMRWGGGGGGGGGRRRGERGLLRGLWRLESRLSVLDFVLQQTGML